MNKLQTLIANCITIFLALFANDSMALTVPFNNYVLNPKATLSADYSFGSNAIIFCYTSNLATTGTFQWSYNGQRLSGSLPMSLTTSTSYTGQLADPTGNTSNGTAITIQNTLNTQIIVSCNFAF